MKDMMGKMMSGMMKPEDMPEMMDKMFSQMSIDDRIQFVSTMMPKCLGMILSEFDSEAKGKLEKEMTNKMMFVFGEHLKQEAE